MQPLIPLIARLSTAARLSQDDQRSRPHQHVSPDLIVCTAAAAMHAAASADLSAQMQQSETKANRSSYLGIESAAQAERLCAAATMLLSAPCAKSTVLRLWVGD